MFDRACMVELLCSVLREEAFAWPALCNEDARQLFDTARDEGVHLLVAHRLWERGRLDDAECVPSLRERLAAALRNQLAAEEIAAWEFQRVLAAFDSSGVRAAVMKGGALAYTHYTSPVLRPRVDSDVLVPAASRSAAAATLVRLGYERIPVTTGDLVLHGAPYAKTDAAGARYVVDVHWEVSNPQVFARALPPGELLAASVPVPQLGDAARALSAVHSLAIACVHRVAHHPRRDRLIWNFDIHLLAERLTDGEREAFVAFAAARQLNAVCVQGLTVAERCFRGEGTARLLETMAGGAAAAGEPSAAFAARPMRKLDVLRSDLATLRGWRAKLALVREHLFPPPAYMHRRYGIRSPAVLPFSYAWRILRGGAGWLWSSATPGDEDE